ETREPLCAVVVRAEAVGAVLEHRERRRPSLELGVAGDGLVERGVGVGDERLRGLGPAQRSGRRAELFLPRRIALRVVGALGERGSGRPWIAWIGSGGRTAPRSKSFSCDPTVGMGSAGNSSCAQGRAGAS